MKEEEYEVIDLQKVDEIGGSTYYHKNFVPLVIVERGDWNEIGRAHV